MPLASLIHAHIALWQMLGSGDGLAADFRIHSHFVNHRRADSCVRQRINQNEAARQVVLLVRIENQRAACLELDQSNFIHLQLIGRMLREVVDVHPMVNP